MPEKACKACNMLSAGPVCPNCRSSNLSEDWSGLLIVFDTESEVAKLMGVKKPGRYAVRVR
ncbi:MAG: transcription elongation factor subunit Spt4 [Candidatus Bathyarchaeia archaeon]